MKTKIVITLLMTLIIGFSGSFAQLISEASVVDFISVDNTINEKVNKYGTNEVLLVLDIDNTILTSDADLGSDIWYQWQAGELDVKPEPKQKLSNDCLYNEAIALLYELGTMKLTDSLLPNYINNWQSKGITVISLTSRSPRCRAATERELMRNNVDLSQAELKTVDGNKLNLEYSINNRELSYSNGIFMTSGMNKGEMLAHIINRSGKSYKSIVFVDDGKKNIDAVKNKYSSCSNADLGLFYYTKIVTERLNRNNNVVLTKEQADKMNADWNYLVNTLNTIFPERLVKSKCMDIK